MDAARRRPRADGHGNGCAALGGLSTHVGTGSHVARRAAASLVFVLVATCRSATEACPRCAAGIEARQQVLSSDLVPNLAIAVLPFLDFGTLAPRVAACLPVTPGAVWHFNAFRIKRPGGPSHPEEGAIYAAWSVPDGSTFHAPAAFRPMVFENDVEP